MIANRKKLRINLLKREWPITKDHLILNLEWTSKNVRTVINFDMPLNPSGYIHRIGRTGRAYSTSASVSLVSPSEIPFAFGMQLRIGLKNTLNYGLERVWAIGYLKNSNKVAIGYDEGAIMIKIGREEPVASLDSSGKIIWAKITKIHTVNIKTVGGDFEVKDGVKVYSL
jgi:hypothetical protein